MKKLIILLTLVALSFSAEKWEYLIMKYRASTILRGDKYLESESFSIVNSEFWKGDTLGSKYNSEYRNNHAKEDGDKGRGYPLLNGLKLLGEDGWELVNVVQKQDYLAKTDKIDFNNIDVTNSQDYFFKRKIEPQEYPEMEAYKCDDPNCTIVHYRPKSK